MENVARPKAVIYCRVSTNRQQDQGFSLESQETRLTQEARLRGYEPEVIREIASGTRDTRPQLLKVLEMLKSGRAEALFVLDLDRLGRSPKKCLEILEQAKKQNWRLVIVSLGADTATPAGEFLFAIMASVAKLESRLTGERVFRQHQARRDRGITWGVDQGCKSNLNPKIRKYILQLRLEGYGYKSIAKKVTEAGYETLNGGLWYPQTIKAILESPQTRQLEERLAQ
jgi:DNA invertase Pin-like site-specific DNA recombinase